MALQQTTVLSLRIIPSRLFVSEWEQDGETWDNISRAVSAYFSGHLHKLFLGLGNHLQAFKPTGFLELEVQDLKLSGVYRIFAVDNDILSYRDVKLPAPGNTSTDTRADARLPAVARESWFSASCPDGLSAKECAPRGPRDTEPLGRILPSARLYAVLIYSDVEIGASLVVLTIDGARTDSQLQPAARPGAPTDYPPLWVAAWTPSAYNDGKAHEITILPPIPAVMLASRLLNSASMAVASQ